MGNACGHKADSFHPFGYRELFFAFSECLLGPLALGDITDVALNHLLVVDQVDITDELYGILCVEEKIFTT